MLIVPLFQADFPFQAADPEEYQQEKYYGQSSRSSQNHQQGKFSILFSGDGGVARSIGPRFRRMRLEDMSC